MAASSNLIFAPLEVNRKDNDDSALMPLVTKSDQETIENKEKMAPYERIISSLPKAKGWFVYELRLYEGFWQPPFPVLVGLMRMQQHFKSQASDVLVATSPKTGTTWLKALVFAIVNRNRYGKDGHPLLTVGAHDCVPQLESDLYVEVKQSPALNDIQSPRLFGTHVPYTSLPKSLLESDSKIVYICRDPKDVLISFWHFISKITLETLPEDTSKVISSDFTLSHAYDFFCEGISPCGPYWDHVLSYWKASIESPHKILFLKYEDMMREPQLYVKQLAEFLGYPFMLQEQVWNVQDIVDLCSFETLSSLEVNKTGIYRACNFSNNAFYRKGHVGDWKNHLTPDMAQRLDEITKQKFHEYGLIL